MDAPLDLRGRTVLVTGANAGIGYWCVEQLAARGARVLLGCRSAPRAATAVAAVHAQVPGADLRIVPLDLGSLANIAAAASALDERIDVVICNAGVKAAAPGERTSDGLDLMMGTNALGHFALLAGLEHALAPDARVVAVGSLAHRFGSLDVRRVDAPWSGASLRQYGRSKAALMAIAFELDRRWSESERSSVSAHPGFAVDPLTPRRPGQVDVPRIVRGMSSITRAWVQGKDDGALPIVHAATDADVVSGDYWGPSGWLEFQGAPIRVATTEEVRSPLLGGALWAAAEEITGVRFAT